MRERSLKARADELLLEESQRPEMWWWLSFADDEGFLGGVLTRARGFLSAVQKARNLGINPGGEVQGIEIPEDVPESHKSYADQLLSKQDIEEKLGGAARMQ
jgi:hypothetical protein